MRKGQGKLPCDMHYAKSGRGRIRRPNRAKRQHFPPMPWRFRDTRLSLGLGVEACADLLRVSERTIRHWESGATRIPYAAYKLMRVLRGGKVLGPEWRGFNVFRGVLVTPEGHRFEAAELSWWSLLVRRARAFSEIALARQGGRAQVPAAAPAAAGTGLVSLFDKGNADCAQGAQLVARTVETEARRAVGGAR